MKAKQVDVRALHSGISPYLYWLQVTAATALVDVIHVQYSLCEFACSGFKVLLKSFAYNF